MDKAKNKAMRRTRRHVGVRKRITGTPQRPRLAVYRSLKHIYAQVIDDLAGKTIASASMRDAEASAPRANNRSGAAAVGKLVAQRAVQAGVKEVSLDRGGFRYHGRVKALADAAREAGLKF